MELTAKLNKQNEIVASIDIGSSKVLVIIAQRNKNELKVLGYGLEYSTGVRQGAVVNIDATVEAVSKAVKNASLLANVDIDNIFVGISGTHISSVNSKGRVSISNEEVDVDDIARVMISAEAITIPVDKEVLHVLPQNYTIDNKTNVEQPLGMYGNVLEAKVHIVIGESSAIKNICKSVEKCGIKISQKILEPLAASQVTLVEDEKKLGVCLIDIGAGITNVSVFIDGSLQHTNVLPIAGGLVTDDIVFAFTMSQEKAETLKKEYGCANSEMIKDDVTIEVEHISDSTLRKLSKRTLTEVIESRYEEIFMEVKNDLVRNGYDDLIPAGFVLTGGASQIEGCSELLQSVFNKPVRLAENKKVTGIDNMVTNPSFAVAIGLLFENNYQKENEKKISLLGKVKEMFMKEF
jgi:cell division protein FtsA